MIPVFLYWAQTTFGACCFADNPKTHFYIVQKKRKKEGKNHFSELGKNYFRQVLLLMDPLKVVGIDGSNGSSKRSKYVLPLIAPTITGTSET